MKKEELRNVDGTDALHPNRSGDVVVVFRPPYQRDAATPGQLTAFSQFFGQHGYLPNLVDLADNINMRGTFIAAGPGIKDGFTVPNMRAIDVAPTLAYLHRHAGAAERPRQDLARHADRNVDVRSRHPRHQRLPRPARPADGGGRQPRRRRRGQPDVRDRRLRVPEAVVRRLSCREAPNGTITVTAGDAVGATPPISAFFGDKPTIELMNMMGFTLDGLGNHNFDQGEQYLRNELIPLADFKYVSANIVDPATGKTPAEWSPSRTIDFGASRWA